MGPVFRRDVPTKLLAISICSVLAIFGLGQPVCYLRECCSRGYPEAVAPEHCRRHCRLQLFRGQCRVSGVVLLRSAVAVSVSCATVRRGSGARTTQKAVAVAREL
ncbi:hypothetical protein J6590_019286 [Homalodisca vitripennis]|nr:hypothetical protein J6590_019286 [Homalodisca vitripennis]